jgi:ribosomal protein L29
MKQLKMRIEEYYPAGQFLRVSFVRDRTMLVSRFSNFTTDYLAEFDTSIEDVRVLEQSVVLTEEQKNATAELYGAADGLSTELNFLKFQMVQSGLDTALVTAIKKDIARHNIEGACQKLVGLNQLIVQHHVVLESKGMAAGFPVTLAATTAWLETKNVLQNQVMDMLKQLHDDNKAVFKALYGFISTIAAAGKIMFKGTAKESEYTITHLLGRMRSSSIPRDGVPPVV